MKTITCDEWDELRRIGWWLYYFPDKYQVSGAEERERLEMEAKKIKARQRELLGLSVREYTLAELLSSRLERPK